VPKRPSEVHARKKKRDQAIVGRIGKRARVGAQAGTPENPIPDEQAGTEHPGIITRHPDAVRDTCGWHGGTTATGDPCDHPAGWGLTWTGSSRPKSLGLPTATLCAEHDAGAAATLQGLKKGLADPFTHLAGACEKIGRDPATIWRWRQADPAFDSAVVEACSSRDALRVHLADDAIFGRILSGKAPPGTEIFWLKNKAPDRFRDRTEVSGPNGSPLAQVHTIMFGDAEITF
jgi:hypothetical protein